MDLMEDREFSKVVGRLKEACRECIKLKEDCRECPYQGDCIRRKHKDTLYVIGKYEEMLWAKTAEVEKLKKELRNTSSNPPVVMDRVTAEQPMISKAWYLSVAEFIRKNIFVEIRCDESLDDMEYVRNVLDAEAAIRAAYGNG